MPRPFPPVLTQISPYPVPPTPGVGARGLKGSHEPTASSWCQLAWLTRGWRLNRLTDNLGHVHGLQPHQVGQLVDDDVPAGLDLVHTLNAAPLPVGPVDEVPQQREPENVWELVLQERPPLCPVDVDHLQESRQR